MKRLFFVFMVVSTNLGFSQETTSVNIYTIFANVVFEPFRFPLIGFFNVANGNHQSPQIGFVNLNTQNFSSLQAGFINTIGGNLDGLQLGFINTSVGETQGAQIGFVNTTSSFKGAQTGFVNTAYKEADGAQIGFVNITNEKKGAQISFINIAKRSVNGVQIGFVNFVDTLEKGVPIGFVSIVRHGGYRAIEFSFTELYPVNIGFKIGVEKIYSTVFLSYNPFEEFSRKSIATGVGLGCILPFSSHFFFNPELNFLSSFGKNQNSLLSLVPYFGYNFNDKMSIVVGPSVTWMHRNENKTLQTPFFVINNSEINQNNGIAVGARVGIRYRF